MPTSTFTIVTLAALACAGLAGCGNGQERGEKTAARTAVVAVDATKAKQDFDKVDLGLKEIRDADDAADLKKLYGGLKGPTSDFNDSIAEVLASADRAVTAGRAQNDEWHRQADTFSDPDLRNASNRRQSDLREAVDFLATSAGTLKTDSAAYLANLNQTLRALDLDLNPQGVHALKPSVSKLLGDEDRLRNDLSDVAAKNRAVDRSVNP